MAASSPEADPAGADASAEADGDLVAAVVLTAATVVATLVPFLADTPLRAVLGFGFVLFVPGYALVSALFPGSVAAGREGTPSGPARVALAVLASVVLAALVGGSLSLVGGLGPTTAVVALAAVTLLGIGVAVRRRRALPPDERFVAPVGPWVSALRSAFLDPGTRGDATLNVLLAVVVVLAVGGTVYATAVPGNGERFTEFYLLAEDADGDLVAAGYPTQFTAGEPRSQYVGLTNREGETVSYTVLVQLQRVTVTNDSVRVREREPLRQFTPEVADGEGWRRNHTVTPTLTGDRLRLTYLLYRGAPPAEPTVGNAYEHAYTWVNVSAANASAANASASTASLGGRG